MFDLTFLSPTEKKAAEELLPILKTETAGRTVRLKTSERSAGLSVRLRDDTAEIAYDPSRRSTFCRALGLLPRVLRRPGDCLTEAPAFDTLRYMPDMSRNGMMHTSALRRLIRYLALLGYNDLMLYLEDGYDIPEYPYFGHGRPRYTERELREIIDYADLFGMTVTPCIQTLGHLKMPLLWPAMRKAADTSDTLYVGNEETYRLIDAMLTALCRTFRVRRFHIGMDEAENVGLGRRLRREGYTERAELMREHLRRVGALCEAHGVRPMIWSDMFFRSLNPGGDYYSPNVSVPREIIDGVPENFTLVYWNYYHTEEIASDRNVFDHMMAEHLRFRNPIAFAGGSWKWTGYAPNNSFSLLAGDFHVRRCRENGIRDIALTAWGDDGAEASAFSALAAAVLYAERLYTDSRDGLEDAFRDIFGMPLSSYLLLDLPNRVPGAPETARSPAVNPSKYFFYADPLCGRLDAHVRQEFAPFFGEAAKRLAAEEDHPEFGYLFRTLSCLCGILREKVTFSLDARAAYEGGNRCALARLADRADRIADMVGRFTDTMRTQWLTENKMTGFENLEMRYGALQARFRGAAAVIRDYLAGTIHGIEALEEPVLPVDPERPEEIPVLTRMRQAVPVTFSISDI